MELHSSDIRIFMVRELRSLLVLVLSLAIAFTASASSQGLNFSIHAFNETVIKFEGDARLGSNGSINLTWAGTDPCSRRSDGWATYHQPMRLWDKATGKLADFTTRFTFVINSLQSTHFADGLTFFLVPNGSQIPVRSHCGAGLAIMNTRRDPSNSSNWFVAVEFDTHRNTDFSIEDPDCSQGKVAAPHVGIDLNSIQSSVYKCVDWFEDKIMSGGKIDVTITYNSSTQNLSIVMVDTNAMGTGINSSAISHIVNLAEYLPEWVTLGFSAATGISELHIIEAWEFNSNVQVAEKKSKLWLWCILGSGSFLLLLVVPVFIWFRYHSERKRTNMSGEEDDIAIEDELGQVLGPKKFSYKNLVMATNNFATERLLGEGGFGRVYEGYLTSVNAHVAIKKISPGSRQGIKEYATEVKTISRLRHRNLVQLIGWCHEKKELLLIYEFMSNGSLDSHLFENRTFLPWTKRYKIAQGIASALLYLHEEWEQCVLHRDVKSSNIMLDSDFNAKLGDFGLARLVDHAKGLRTTALAGTIGYMAPEYIYTGKASRESDVYSFGIILLEIACGRKVIELGAEESQVQLVDWVWELYGAGRILDAAESKLGTDFDDKQLECLMVAGLWCAHPDHTARPSIREAFSVLNFNTPPPTLPSKLPVLFSQASIISSHAILTSITEVSTFTTSFVQSSHPHTSTLLQNTI